MQEWRATRTVRSREMSSTALPPYVDVTTDGAGAGGWNSGKYINNGTNPVINATCESISDSYAWP